MKGRSLLVAAVLALAVAGGASSARPCEKAVVDDWYADGTIDGAWSCDCLQRALELLDRSPAETTQVRDALKEIERQQCVAGGPVVTLTFVASAGGADEARSGDDHPWEYVLVGGVALGLGALVVAALLRRRRPPLGP